MREEKLVCVVQESQVFFRSGDRRMEDSWIGLLRSAWPGPAGSESRDNDREVKLTRVAQGLRV